MTNKKKKTLYVKIIILILSVLIIIRIFTLVLSKYETDANSTADVDIAFYLLKEDYKNMTLNLRKIVPQNNEYTYIFTVGNEEEGKVAETDLEYDLTLRTTTNLPLTYELYMNGKNAIVSEDIKSDEQGTYFRTITTQTQELTYKEAKTNQYELIVHFPINYNTTNYQDIMEMLEITVNSRQVRT